MSKQDLLMKIRDTIVNLDFDKSNEYTLKALKEGVNPQDIILHSIAEGMDIVGKKFEASEYFLSELIVAGEIGKEITKILEPQLKSIKIKKLAKVAVGTVRGDLHDIGKNIVAIMLEAAGFEVIDLGADVSPETFVESVRKDKPDIIGLSALLTVTMTEMGIVVEELKKAGLRKKVKIIIGGAAVTEEFTKSIGADSYGANAVQGVRVCKEWASEKKKNN